MSNSNDQQGPRQADAVVMWRYSPQSPDAAGWYWMRWRRHGELREEVVEVFLRPGRSYLAITAPDVCQHTKREFLAVAKINAEWAGPIPRPT